MKYLPLLLLVLACSAPPPPLFPSFQAVPEGAVLKYHLPDGRCSAVAVAPRLAATAGHCTGTGFGTLEGPGGTYQVESDQASPEADVAWLYTSSDMPVTAAPSPDVPELGELVWLSGYGCTGDLMTRPAAWTGIPHRERYGSFQVAGVLCRGDSGGAMFDTQGRVVAVISAKHNSPLPIGWVVPLAFAPPVP